MNLADSTEPARSNAGLLGLAIALVLWSAAAHAGGVNVRVTDATGQPLPQAVVSLEPVTGRLTVKPNPWLEVSQVKRQFRPQVSVVTVGTSVVFANFDTVRHHVYSFSSTKTFELKLYAGVPNMPVVFDKPGIAVIGCNIHDQMAAWIAVLDTPYYAQTGADGKARINAVAAGSYRLKVWHPGLTGSTDGVVSAVAVGTNDVDQAVQLTVGDNPLAMHL
ncbi:MAG: methylamine utilization protein [Rhizobacter sp.]